jgi:hypothetical protein
MTGKRYHTMMARKTKVAMSLPPIRALERRPKLAKASVANAVAAHAVRRKTASVTNRVWGGPPEGDIEKTGGIVK